MALAAQQFAVEKAEIDTANRELIERGRKESSDALARITSEMAARVFMYEADAELSRED